MSDQRFNTGNPIGSNSPLDRSDNTRNLDLAVNSDELSWSDRFGRDRKSFEGMEREFDADQDDRDHRFNAFIVSSGYQFAGDYAPGIEITEYNQVIRDEDGEFWRVSGQVELPYTTTGAGIPEDDALVPAGDAVLRQDLANPDKGAAMVAYGGGTVEDSLQSLEDFAGGAQVDLLTAKRFRGTANDDAGSPDGIFAVTRSHSASSSPHSFRDNTSWYPPTGEWAMASYDANARIYDDNDTDHFIDYQSRGRKFGTGRVKDFWGFATVGRIDAGSATRATGFENRLAIYTNATCGTYTSFQSQPVVHGSVTTLAHFQVRATTGIAEGVVGSEIGYYVKALNKAPSANTYPIYIDPQPAGVRNLISCPSHHGGDIEFLTKDSSLVLRSPNGTRWRLSVADDGALSAVPA